VAVAAVVVNEARWRIRAPWLAREALRLGLRGDGRHLAAAPGTGASASGLGVSARAAR